MNTNSTLKATEIPLPWNPELNKGCEKLHIKCIDGLIAIDPDTFDDERATHIIVHDGMFHVDELVALALLTWFLDITIDVERTRVMSKMIDDWADFVIDVGEGNFDHHGKRNDGTSAAASRVFRALYQNPEIKAMFGEKWWSKVATVVNLVCDQDNGKGYHGLFPFVADMAKLSVTDDSGINWFEKARKMVEESLHAKFRLYDIETSAEMLAEDAIIGQKDADIVVFPEGTRAAPVKQMLWQFRHPAIYYISEEQGTWAVLCCAVPKESEDDVFNQQSSRFLIPEEFRGLSGNDFRLKLRPHGIESGIFCHALGFIAKFGTKDDAIRFARLCMRKLVE